MEKFDYIKRKKRQICIKNKINKKYIHLILLIVLIYKNMLKMVAINLK